jgi:hypothetical protein
MPEEKLDPLKLASRIMAEPRTGPALCRMPDYAESLGQALFQRQWAWCAARSDSA